MQVLKYITHSISKGTYIIRFENILDDVQFSLQFAPFSHLMISGEDKLDLSLITMRDSSMVFNHLACFGFTSILKETT